MKKISKILCAVLVVAVLCSSLLFAAGAADGAQKATLLNGYTSTTLTSADGSKMVSAIKADVDGNLFYQAGISHTGGNGDTIEWGNPGGRGSEIITNTATGEEMYREFYIPGEATVKDYQTLGNDFINYNFTKRNKSDNSTSRTRSLNISKVFTTSYV